MLKRIASTVIAALGLLPGAASAWAVGVPSVGFAAGGTGMTPFYVIGFELGPWQQYLAQELTPDYMRPDDSAPVRVSWLNSTEVDILPEFAAGMQARPQTWLNLKLDYQSASEYGWQGVEPEPVYEGNALERQFFAPGVEHQLTENGILGGSAVIAHQRFSAANLGLFAALNDN